MGLFTLSRVQRVGGLGRVSREWCKKEGLPVVQGWGGLGLGGDRLFNGVAGSVGVLLAGRVSSCGVVHPD